VRGFIVFDCRRIALVGSITDAAGVVPIPRRRAGPISFPEALWLSRGLLPRGPAGCPNHAGLPSAGLTRTLASRTRMKSFRRGRASPSTRAGLTNRGAPAAPMVPMVPAVPGAPMVPAAPAAPGAPVVPPDPAGQVNPAVPVDPAARMATAGRTRRANAPAAGARPPVRAKRDVVSTSGPSF